MADVALGIGVVLVGAVTVVVVVLGTEDELATKGEVETVGVVAYGTLVAEAFDEETSPFVPVIYD